MVLKIYGIPKPADLGGEANKSVAASLQVREHMTGEPSKDDEVQVHASLKNIVENANVTPT